jgi:hypothetical protein
MNMKSFLSFLSETIVKSGSGFAILSQKGKRLGKYPTKEKAVERLRQIEYFKRHK